MSALSGAVETAPVSGLHAIGSRDPADFGVPGGREEEWRFTPLRRLRGLHADAGLGSAGVTVEIDPAPEIEYAERSGLSEWGNFVPTDRVSARAFAAARRATVVTVPKDTVASRPTVIRVTGSLPPKSGISGMSGVGAPGVGTSGVGTSGVGTSGVGASGGVGGATAGHTVIDVQPYGRAVIVLDQRGTATYADNVEISVADGGDLTFVSIADWDDDAVQVSHHQVTLGRDAHIKHVAVTLGGSLVRLSPMVRYAGPGGDAELYGICFADVGQHLEHRLFVDHDVPNCRSRVRYKGALRGDDAHTVWIGDVLIRPEAVGTDTYEYNRNLVLTDGARADSVPNLEILTGEVLGAGHASANGRLEDDHLFYLMARGIPIEEARRLVIRGFFGELIEKIGIPEIETRIGDAIEAELSRAGDRAGDGA